MREDSSFLRDATVLPRKHDHPCRYRPSPRLSCFCQGAWIVSHFRCLVLTFRFCLRLALCPPSFHEECVLLRRARHCCRGLSGEGVRQGYHIRLYRAFLVYRGHLVGFDGMCGSRGTRQRKKRAMTGMPRDRSLRRLIRMDFLLHLLELKRTG